MMDALPYLRTQKSPPTQLFPSRAPTLLVPAFAQHWVLGSKHTSPHLDVPPEGVMGGRGASSVATSRHRLGGLFEAQGMARRHSKLGRWQRQAPLTGASEGTGAAIRGAHGGSRARTRCRVACTASPEQDAAIAAPLHNCSGSKVRRTRHVMSAAHCIECRKQWHAGWQNAQVGLMGRVPPPHRGTNCPSLQIARTQGEAAALKRRGALQQPAAEAHSRVRGAALLHRVDALAGTVNLACTAREAR